MSLEQAVVQLEQTNAALQEEVVRFRDAAMGLNAVYSTITEGRQNTADGKYFSVPGNGAYMRLYRRTGSSAELIAEYPSRESMVEAINEATADAEARANAAADRAEVYADNKEFVTLERFRKQATLDLDFGAGDYSVDDGDKLRTTDATDLLAVERATPKWVFGPNGKLREVPPNTLARQWNPETGEPEGVLIEESRTNLLLWSEDFTQSVWPASGDSRVEPSVIAAPSHNLADKFVVGTGTGAFSLQQSLSIGSDDTVVGSVYAKAGGVTQIRVRVGRGSIQSIAVSLIDGTILTTGSSVLSYEVEPAGDGWFRISVRADLSVSTGVQYFAINHLVAGSSLVEGDGTSGIYIWGAQVEWVSS